MEHFNNFIIISSIKNFTALLISKENFLPSQYFKAVKCTVTVILCVDLDIEIQMSFTKESSLFDHVQKSDH